MSIQKYLRVSSEFKVNEDLLVISSPFGSVALTTHSNTVPCKSRLMFEIYNTDIFDLGLLIVKPLDVELLHVMLRIVKLLKQVIVADEPIKYGPSFTPVIEISIINGKY